MLSTVRGMNSSGRGFRRETTARLDVTGRDVYETTQEQEKVEFV